MWLIKNIWGKISAKQKILKTCEITQVVTHSITSEADSISYQNTAWTFNAQKYRYFKHWGVHKHLHSHKPAFPIWSLGNTVLSKMPWSLLLTPIVVEGSWYVTEISRVEIWFIEWYKRFWWQCLWSLLEHCVVIQKMEAAGSSKCW